MKRKDRDSRSGEPRRYFLPADTAEVLSRRRESDARNYDHWSYFVHFMQQNPDAFLDAQGRLLETVGGRSQDRLFDLFNDLRLSERQKAALRHARARRHERLVHLSATHVVRVVRGRPRWAWLHGFGGEHVRETSLTIHPVYGVPYIPGSVVKGALLHWVLEAFFRGDLRQAVQALPGRSEEKGTGALEPGGETVVEGERLAAIVLREAFGFRGDDDDFYRGAVQFWDVLRTKTSAWRPTYSTPIIRNITVAPARSRRPTTRSRYRSNFIAS